MRANGKEKGWTLPAAIPYNSAMNITLNGQDFELPEGATIAALVKMRRESGHLRTTAYAVERNKEVVVRPQHESTRLHAGDRIEIVVMVGGG
jgi:sulfur carrier protein